MCNLFVRSCSCMNCLTRKVPAANGRSAASAAVQIDMSVTNHAQIIENQ